MARPIRYVIGQYKCGCTYGPVPKRERLNYCGRHGEDIQSEYPVPQPKLPTNDQIKSWFIEMITHCDGLAIIRWNEIERFLDECEDFPNLRALFGQKVEEKE